MKKHILSIVGILLLNFGFLEAGKITKVESDLLRNRSPYLMDSYQNNIYLVLSSNDSNFLLSYSNADFRQLAELNGWTKLWRDMKVDKINGKVYLTLEDTLWVWDGKEMKKFCDTADIPDPTFQRDLKKLAISSNGDVYLTSFIYKQNDGDPIKYGRFNELRRFDGSSFHKIEQFSITGSSPTLLYTFWALCYDNENDILWTDLYTGISCDTIIGYKNDQAVDRFVIGSYSNADCRHNESNKMLTKNNHLYFCYQFWNGFEGMSVGAGGFSEFDIAKREWNHFGPETGMPVKYYNGMYYTSVNDVVIGDNGNGWIAASLGLMEFKNNLFSVIDVAKELGVDSTEQITNWYKSIDNIELTEDGTLWVGISGLGLFKIEGLSGIKDSQIFSDGSVYPNPVIRGNTLNLKQNYVQGAKSVEIYDVLGNKTFSAVNYNGIINDINIATDKLSSGVYYLKIQYNGKICKAIKFIVE